MRRVGVEEEEPGRVSLVPDPVEDPRQRFPHHVAITPATIGNVLWEAFGNYLGFDVFHTRQATPGQYQTAMPFNQEP